MVACLAATRRPSSVSRPVPECLFVDFQASTGSTRSTRRRQKKQRQKRQKRQVWTFDDLLASTECLVFIVVYYRPGPGQLFN